VSVTKDLGNYVLSGTLHVTLSPEDAKNIQWQERAVDEAIEKTTALMPEVTEQASRLVQQREDIGVEEDRLGKLERQNQDLRRMVQRIKDARGPPGLIFPAVLSVVLSPSLPPSFPPSLLPSLPLSRWREILTLDPEITPLHRCPRTSRSSRQTRTSG